MGEQMESVCARRLSGVLTTVTVATLASTISCGPAVPRPERRVEVDVEATYFSGSSGVQVFILPDESTNVAQLSVHYTAGSSSDPEGKAGLAHLVEHLMFQKPRPSTGKPFSAELQRIGYYFNAYTTEDSTHYDVQFSPEHLQEAVAIESERLASGCAGIDQATFETEREVVRNEIRRHYTTPRGRIHELLREATYPPGHPYRTTPGGNDEQLANATLKDVCAFVADHYQPHRTIFVVAGNVTTAQAEAATKKWLARVPPARARMQPPDIPEVELARRSFVYQLPVERPQLYVMWSAPPTYTDDGRMLPFIAGNLEAQLRRFNAMYHFAETVQAVTLGGNEAPILCVAVSLYDRKGRKDALDFVRKSRRWVERSMARGGRQETAATWSFRRTYGSEALVARVEPLLGRADFYANAAQFDPGGGFVVGHLRALHDAKPRRVRSLAHSLLDPKKAVVVTVQPDGTYGTFYRDSGLSFEPDSIHDDRGRLVFDPSEADWPLPIPPASPRLRLERYRLSNGLRVVLWPDAELPLVRARLIVRSGIAHEPVKRAGTASIASGGDAGMDVTLFDARELSTEADFTIRRLANHLRGWGFGDMAYLRKRLRNSASTKRYREIERFRRSFYEGVYGKGHPYAKTGMPTERSLSRIKGDVTTRYLRSRYIPNNSVLLVVGKFDVEAMKTYIDEFIGFVPKKKVRDAPVTAPAAPQSQPEHIAVSGHGSPLVTILVGFPGGVGIDRDHAARRVLVAMLDAQLKALRQELALSYDVSASYTPRIGPGLWEISGTFDSTRAAEAMTAIKERLQMLRSNDSGIEECFVRARRELLRAYTIDTRNGAEVLERLTFVTKFRLDVGYRDRMARQIAQLRLADVRQLVDTELAQQREVVAVHGPAASVSNALAAAKKFDTDYAFATAAPTNRD